MSLVDHLTDQLYLRVINKIVIPKKNKTVERYLKVLPPVSGTLTRNQHRKRIVCLW